MKSKKMMALVTAAAMAFGLAGCGGGNTAATTAAPAEKAEEKTTAAEAVTAVSYTHLDVYKRQVEASDLETCEKYVDQVIKVMEEQGHCL